MLKVLDPQHKEELHGYLQMVDDEVMDKEVSEEEEGEGESINDSSSELSGSNSEESDSHMECEVDEKFREEIKIALGDAALPSSEVCSVI